MHKYLIFLTSIPTENVTNVAPRHLFAGVSLPNTIYQAGTAPYMNTFIIIGGTCSPCSNAYLDTVLRYTEDGEWEEMPTKLASRGAGFTAIPVPAKC